VVVLEKLEVRNMVRSAAGSVEKPGKNVRAKAGLNRAIHDQGWGMFRTMLGWKLAERGGRLVEVPAQNTSRTCAECGVVGADSRNGQRFRCTACGHEAHADTNAAIEILRYCGGARRGECLWRAAVGRPSKQKPAWSAPREPRAGNPGPSGPGGCQV
jgi:putative transposase